MKKLFFLVLGAGLLLGSCAKEDSNDVNQDKIWTEYKLFYNQNDDVTDAIARFRFGGATGTLLELTDSTGASVTFDGQTMPYSNLWGAHHLQFAGNVTTGTFAYTNTDGTTYTNSVPGPAQSTAFPIGFDTIVKSQAESLAWAGTALAANEHMGLFIGTWTWGEDALFFNDALGSTDIVLGVNAKSNLALGQATAYMDRTLSVPVTQGTSEGGVIQYKYRCTNATVEVVP